MIAKIKTGKFFKGAFQYNLNKIKEGKASFFYNTLFKTENPTFDEMVEEFREMSMMCPKVSNPVFHTSVNFSPDEYLEDDKLQCVIEEYMQRLGYGNTPYVVFKHTDVEHQHVHIISANIENQNGKYRKIRDNHLHRRSEAISRAIEREYGLIIATDVKRKQKELDKLIPELKGYGEVSTYSQLREVADFVVKYCVFTDLSGLNKILHKYNIACFQNKTKTGEEYYKFTFQNPATRKNVGVGGTPSQLGLNFTSEDLSRIFDYNKQKETQFSLLFQEYGRALLEKYISVTLSDLDGFLKEMGCVKVDQNSYLDQKNKVVFSKYQLGLPSAFISSATLKKEYFAHIVKSATEYRKILGVFHESTMYSSPELIQGFRNYFNTQDIPLSEDQKGLLLDRYCTYKLNNLNSISEKEHERDIQLVGKMYDYISRLNLSEKCAWLLLEKFNIFKDDGTVKIGNNMDRVIHKLSLGELPSFHPSGHDYSDSFFSLTDKEFELIRSAIDDKPCFINKNEVEWERVAPFIPEDYAERYSLEESNIEGEYIGGESSINQQSIHRAIFNSKNEKEFLYRKKKKKINREEHSKKKGKLRL